jgi:cobalt/nickel transport system permease protein
MHISEGALSASVLVAGAAITFAGTAVGLKKLDYDRIPRVSVLTATFFVASLIHVPVGISSAHLILNGLIGLLLGWTAFPAILVALFLQAVLFQFGGLTTLGVNTATMAGPAVLCYYLFGAGARKMKSPLPAVFGFLCGATAVLFSGLLVGTALILTDRALEKPAFTVVAVHLPIMAVEGILTAVIVSFFRAVRPEILGAPYEKPQLQN